MKLPTQVHRVGRYLRSLPKKYYIFSFVGILVLLYAITFFVPKTVAFSYSGETCTKQLTLLPSLHNVTGDQYAVDFKDEWRIGSVSLASFRSCFERTAAPVSGADVVGVAPFGSVVFRKHFSISIDELPKVASVTREAVPATKPYKVPLTKTDRLHTYELTIADATTACASEQSALSCDITTLDLAQGKQYDYSLTRHFEGETKQTLSDGSLKTLKAVKITKASVQNKQIVYARPKTFELVADKPLKSAAVKITNDDTVVQTNTSTDGTRILVKLDKELPREKSYNLVVETVDAEDGSTLIEPYSRSFSTSGGPKVKNVSVGQSGVTQSAAITVTFDQALAKDGDITKFVGFSGGGATVRKLNDTQALVQLNTLPLCAPFTITVKKGIQSKYDIGSAKDWSFSSRIVCHTIVQYGTSLQGRPLIAYIFGASGPTTMYTGAIHGNESSSSGLMQAWVDELEANPSRIQGKRIVVIPTINPDGVAAGTRTNSRGVNLSRNFPTDNWISDINDTDGKHKGGGGKQPLSEPETAGLARITQQYRPKLLLSYHAIGSLVVGDAGGYSASYAARYASMVGYRNATGSGGTFDYDITGSYEDWTFRNQGIPSMIIELGSYTDYYIAHHRNALWAMVQ